MKFYRCNRCGQIIAKVKDSKVPIICCGEEMKEIIPGTSDGAVEKHIPVYEVKDNIVNVQIGSVPHPMEEKHYIEWVALETKLGNQRKLLKPGIEPKVSFALLANDQVIAVYAYCNIHSLWKK